MIKTYKLENIGNSKIHKETLNIKLYNLQGSIEKPWESFNTIILETTKITCGYYSQDKTANFQGFQV